MDAINGPITRQGMHPAVGYYGFRDARYKGCTFALHPSPDGVAGGAVTTRNCEGLLPQLSKAVHWEPDALQGLVLKAWGSAAVRVAALVDHEEPMLRIFKTPKRSFELAIHRLDAPNLRRPARLALGWWTISTSTKGERGFPDARFALLMNGRISVPNRSGGHYDAFDGGYWRADEGKLKLTQGRGIHGTMAFYGSGKTLTRSFGHTTMTMVQE